VRWLGLLLALLVAGCSSLESNAERNRHADALAAQAGLQRATLELDGFVLTSFQRITRADLPLHLYIEGDGFAWRSRSQPSDDPTPRRALGLALAAADPGPNVVYLARPCQFTSGPRCTLAYWTGRRFAEEVVVAMDQAVSQYAARAPGQGIELIGYSGGGAIAVLLAARRDDVLSLRTVAGNLDQAEVNRLHKVTPMPESLNAIDVASQVAGIPQIHYSGSDDKVIPPGIAQRFVARAGGACARVVTLAGLSHEGDWASRWSALLATTPECSPAP
jgi:hypothetical protein